MQPAHLTDWPLERRAVAEGHGRDSIGIDLDPRNLTLAQQRVGMFLEVA
jgi:hypothetical protein